MSNQPPGGSHPGQEPWVGQQPGSYHPPTDPWGVQDPWGQPPASTPPGGPGSPTGYPIGQPLSPGGDPTIGQTVQYASPFPPPAAESGWTTPTPMPPKKGNGVIIGIITALAILILAGGGFTLYLLNRNPVDPGKDVAADVSQPAADPSEAASPSTEPSANPSEEPETPAPDASANVLLVKVGDCVRNDGTVAAPKLLITECGPQTYEVLARIDGATTGKADAQRKCSSVAGYTDWYFYNAALDDLDFVLCLKRR